MQPFVVRSQEDALGLLNELVVQSVFEQNVVGLDTETTGCNPAKESPVDRARLWCMTVAWGPPRAPDQVGPSNYRTAFVPQEHVVHLAPWLENPDWLKATTNGYGYDRHVFHNYGVELRGIAGCTSAMSRLLNPSKNAGHGLDDWGARLGYRVEQGKYRLLTTVPTPGPVHKKRAWFCQGCYRSPLRKRKYCLTCEGTIVEVVEAEWQTVNWVMKELEELWEDYPDRRAAIVEYACQDPAMSLDVFHHLRAKLTALGW